MYENLQYKKFPELWSIYALQTRRQLATEREEFSVKETKLDSSLALAKKANQELEVFVVLLLYICIVFVYCLSHMLLCLVFVCCLCCFAVCLVICVVWLFCSLFFVLFLFIFDDLLSCFCLHH